MKKIQQLNILNIKKEDLLEKIIERIRLENLTIGLSKGETKEVYDLMSGYKAFAKVDKVNFETNALLVFLFKNGYIQTKGEK